MGLFQDLLSWFRLRPPLPPPRPPQPPPTDPGDLNRVLLKLHNEERAQAARPPLTLSTTIIARALHAAEVQADRGRVGHFTPLPPDFAENVAAGQRTPEEVMESWMSSRGHRANILGPYTVCGFGRVGDYWAARFA